MADLAAKRDDRALVQLVEEHRQIKSHPLHLAIAFRPVESEDDVVLFEVSENFADNTVNEDKSFF